uniref:Uncharacterized protein n=1 Tax=Arundo donax TaxID=35708 RepID=A0A0A9FG37_ARUDO
MQSAPPSEMSSRARAASMSPASGDAERMLAGIAPHRPNPRNQEPPFLQESPNNSPAVPNQQPIRPKNLLPATIPKKPTTRQERFGKRMLQRPKQSIDQQKRRGVLSL